MQMPRADDPLFRSNPFTFFKALLYDEYYADMSPSDDPFVSLESSEFTCFLIALLYERAINADSESPSSETRDRLISLDVCIILSYKRALKKVNGFEQNKGSYAGDMSA